MLNVACYSSDMAKKEEVKFRAFKVVKEPVTVKFKTKDGQTVSFKAIETTKKPTTVRFDREKR